MICEKALPQRNRPRRVNQKAGRLPSIETSRNSAAWHLGYVRLEFRDLKPRRRRAALRTGRRSGIRTPDQRIKRSFTLEKHNTQQPRSAMKSSPLSNANVAVCCEFMPLFGGECPTSAPRNKHASSPTRNKIALGSHRDSGGATARTTPLPPQNF